jgi:hypothetical protein
MLLALVFSEMALLMLRTGATLSEIKTFPREKTLTGAGASFLHTHWLELRVYNGVC